MAVVCPGRVRCNSIKPKEINTKQNTEMRRCPFRSTVCASDFITHSEAWLPNYDLTGSCLNLEVGRQI